jgi:hypothetical protein
VLTLPQHVARNVIFSFAWAENVWSIGLEARTAAFFGGMRFTEGNPWF